MTQPQIRTEISTEEEEDIFKEGDIIDDKYKVIRRLGKGGYGNLFFSFFFILNYFPLVNRQFFISLQWNFGCHSCETNFQIFVYHSHETKSKF
jgi:hypothetical protein